MASVYVRKGVWYARFQHRGKDYLRSTKVLAPAKGKAAIAESKALAEAELQRFMAEVKGGESVDALLARLNEALSRLPKSELEPRRLAIAHSLRQGVTTRLSLSDAWQAWLDSPKKGRPSETTIINYHANWGRDTARRKGRLNGNSFRVWIAASHPHVSYMDEVTESVAEGYASFLMKSKLAPRTYNGRIKFLRSMFKVLKTRAGLINNPWEGIPLIENETQGRRDLSEKEIVKVCSCATGDIRYLLAIGLYTGLRLGDAVSLKWAGDTVVDKLGKTHMIGIDLDHDIIRLIPQKTRRKQKVLSIPIHPVLKAMLTQKKAEENVDDVYLFPNLASLHSKRGAADITRRIQAHFKACGIETTEMMADGSRKRAIVRVGFHSLRHSFVSLCAANKVPQHAIQELVGHGSPAMTAVYTHASDQQRADAIEALPAIVFADQK